MKNYILSMWEKYRFLLYRHLIIMKATLFLLIAFTLQSNANIMAQTVSLEKKGMHLIELFREIKRQTGYTIICDAAILNNAGTVDAKLEHTPLKEALAITLQPKGLDYVIEGTSIVVRKADSKQANTGRVTTPVEVQQQVSGQVTDSETGDPVAGAVITLKGTSISVQTNADGRYTIAAPDGNTVLVFSFIGYSSQELTVGTQESVNVQLVPEQKQLSEVVVIGYGQQRKTDVTSAVASVKSEDFVTGPVPDAATLLKGKVAGLSVSNPDGDPNSTAQVLLRGTNTINGANTGVLVIVDGIPGDLNTVAPEDIADISVLKDGSSAAIYGVRGSNGVIIITTKKAKGDKIKRISYSGTVSTTELTRAPELLTAQDYRDQIASGFRDASYDLGSSTDWIKALSKKFPVSNVHNLTFSGGNSETNYNASLSYRYLSGVFQQSQNQRITGRVDINHAMFDGKLKFNLGMIQSNGDRLPFNGFFYRQAMYMNPTAPVRMPDGKFYQEPNNFDYQNPLSDLYDVQNKINSFRSRYNGSVTWSPIEGLRLSALGSYTKSGGQNMSYETQNAISTLRDNRNGVANVGQDQTIDRFLNLSAEYAKNFGEHRFTVLGGYEYQDYNRFASSIQNRNFPTDYFGYNQIQLGVGQKTGLDVIRSSRGQSNLISYFARGTYNYADKYLLLASLRVDGASQLYGASQPFGRFPSVQVGWRITEENFMQGQHIFDDLKLRLGYGVTGNQPSDAFLAVGLLGYGNNILYNGEWIQTLSPSQNANPALRWEEKHETNIGLDYSLLNGLFTGSVDYYERKITGLLYNYTVPSPPNLFNSTMANVGTMQNKGVEVALNVNPFRKGDFQWTSTFLFSTNTNKLVSLSNDLYQATVPYFTTGYTGAPLQTSTNIVQIGHNIGDFYGFKVVGISEDGYWQYEEPDGTIVPFSEFKHAFEDKQVLGNGLPKYYAGWNNTLSYKNWDFSVTMRGAFGYQVLNSQRMYFDNPGIMNYNNNKAAYDVRYGTAVLNKNVPLEFNSYYVENGDFWKIDNINVGYSFNNIQSKYIHNPRISVSTLNTFIITKYKGPDPEVDRLGLDPGIDNRDAYPSIRTYSVSLSASF